MKKITRKFTEAHFWTGLGMLILPMAVDALPPNPTPLNTLFDQMISTLTTAVIPFLFVVASVVFIYAVVRYIYSSGDSTVQEKMRAMILWSVIGLAATISLWAIVAFLYNYFGVYRIPTNPYQ